MKYKAIIVDDESLAREMLQEMVAITNAEIKISALCEDIPEAVKAINKYRPDIVFLDVDMPHYKGIDIVDFFETIDFEIVFTTAHQEYAIHAIRMNAFDYLLKPIDMQELQSTITKFLKKKEHTEVETKYKDKLLVSTTQGIHFVDIEKIFYLKAEGAYTKIIAADNVVLSSKNLKFYEEYFSGNANFVRCHKSYLLNRNKVISINKSRQEVTLSNGDSISISLEKIDLLTNPHS